jgi:hypothetical protein
MMLLGCCRAEEVRKGVAEREVRREGAVCQLREK